jgi:RimJ/RimL family protein N-acetyltransferase
MIWKDLTTEEDINRLVEFETHMLTSADLTPVADYLYWMNTKCMKFHCLLDLKKEIMGEFQVFEEDGKVYMGGFVVSKKHRGTHVSKTLMRKLIHEYGDKEIIAKTKADNIPMRKLLKSFGFENKIDRFEKGVLWSDWHYVLGNAKIVRK